MPRIGIGLGLGLYGGSIDAQAQAHYNRVIADGGVVPAGVSGTNAFFNAVKTIYATSDITTAVSVGVDAHYLGYKLGAGAGETSGQAVQKLYSCAGSSGDVVQTTAASQPLLLAHNGASTANYYYGSGVSGNYVSTPNASANQITGDIEIIAKFRINSLSNAGIILSKWSSNSNSSGSYELYYSGSSRFQFYIQRASNGLAGNVLSGLFSLTINTDIYIKVNRIASTGAVNFYQSTDGITYNLISTTTLFAGENIYNSTALVKIGSEFAVDQTNINAKIYRATIANSIGGTPVVDFNPATYTASTSQTQWTSTTGEVWTINTGTAATGYKGVLVDRTIVQGDGVDDRISVTGLTTIPLVSTYQSKTYYPASITAKGGFLISTLSGTSGEYGTGPSSTRWYSDNAYFIAQFAPGALRSLYYAKFKTNAQDFKINNGTSPTITNQPFSGANCLFLFSDNTTLFMNVQYQTFVMSKIEDNPTQVTAMYNYIRSINNNAF